MGPSKNHEGPSNECSGQELNEDQLSAVVGAAASQLTGLRRLSRRTTATSVFLHFDFGELVGIHPDLEEPKWPKPKEPPPPPPPPPPGDSISFPGW